MRHPIAGIRQRDDRWFQRIADSSLDVLFCTDRGGVLVYASAAIERLLGYRPADVLGRHIADFFCPAEHPQLFKRFAHLMSGGTLRAEPTTLRRPDGSTIAVAISASPIIEAEDIVGIQGAIRDIRDHRMAEISLRESEAVYRSILELSMDGFWLADEHGRFLAVNDAFCRMSGYSRAELLQMSIADVEARESSADVAQHIRHIAETGIDRFLTLHRTKSGAIRDVEVSTTFLPENHTLAVFLRDVTDRRLADEALRASEQRYRAYIDNSPSGVFVCDLTGRYTEVNRSACRLLGYTEKELLERSIPDILAPEDVPAAMIAFQELCATGAPISGEYRFLRKDGSSLFMSVNAAPAEAGKLIAFCGDITVRKTVEQELRVYNQAMVSANDTLREFYEQAEAATKAKSEFLANMSHEIRTPMTAILGFTEILQESATTPEALEAVTTIRRNGEYLLEILNSILDLSKIEAGRLTAEYTACSPTALAVDVVALMHVRAEAKNLQLEMATHGPIPCTIQSDPTRLRQILFNLVGNAIKFTELGSVRVVVREDCSAETPLVAFDVIDTGIGISAEQLPRLFQPFTQADTSTSRKFGGTGLGLTISKRLAQMLGGDIRVSSVPGRGSTFTLTIDPGVPDNPPTGTSPVQPTATADPGCPTAANSPADLQCRLLLAEDGPDNQRLISFLLKRAGAEVVVAENGQVAVDLAREAAAQGRPFAAILMDMQMPVLDGYAATKQLRAGGWKGPIIALTAHAMIEDRQRCLDAGCDEYLAKPVQRSQLLAVIAQFTQPPQDRTSVPHAACVD